MIFSSALFLFYFLPIFLAVYFLIPTKLQNIFTALVSILFYAWGAPHFFPLFILSCLADYVLALRLVASKTQERKKVFLVASTLLNLGLLLYFKYANFFVSQLSVVASAAGLHAPNWTTVVLPIGISFFTFHKISYVVDIYRGTSRPARSFGEYLLYIAFFPQLIAGPIVRYHEIEEQIRGRSISFELVTAGVWRFVLGLSSKLLIADPLGTVADHVFTTPPLTLSTSYTWLGTIAYTLQIYFDFAGYSSMAIGLALLVGFHFPENFNRPYLSGSITEFWRRWHISLSRWMRDYLYIPLGGNRVSKARQMANLWIVFLLSGLWHGANWSFLFWGAYHGSFLAFERTAIGQRYLTLPVWIRRPVTLIAVMFGWVLFRSNTLAEGVARWGRLLGISAISESAPRIARATIISDVGIGVFIVGVVWCLCIEPLFERGSLIKEPRVPLYRQIPTLYPLALVLFVLCIFILEAGHYSPFIYFQF